MEELNQHSTRGHTVGSKRVVTIGLLIAYALICSASSIVSQQLPPQLYMHAAACLHAEAFLPLSKSGSRTFGFFLDAKSYPHERVVYVVDYDSAASSSGRAFTVFVSEHGGQQQFDAQNNASFVVSKQEVDGINFLNPPLGGAWTQQHLISAIKLIEKSTRYKLSEDVLSLKGEGLSCGSYRNSL